MNNDIPKIIKNEPWLVDLRNKPKEIKSEWTDAKNIRWIYSSQEGSDEATIFVVDKDNGTTAIGIDGKPRNMEIDNTPCSCDEYRAQGIAEGWIEE